MTTPGDKEKALKILVSIGSSGMIAFGIWHFFVPALWDWYSYIAPEATELVVAIRAINAFFSLCLVLIGTADFLLVWFPADRFSRIVMFSMTTVLWMVRVLFQIIYPQGSLNPALQYGMLAVFLLILGCFAISSCLCSFQKRIPEQKKENQ
jgi:hypothetical protein